MDRHGTLQLLKSRSGLRFIPESETGGTALCGWAGVCRMLPVPILDDILVRQARRRVVRNILKRRGITSSRQMIKSIAHWENRSFLAIIGYLFRSLLLKPLKIVFRTIFFWLAIRDAGKTMVETWLLGVTIGSVDEYLLNYYPREVGQSFGAAVRAVDHHIADHFARKVWRKVRRKPDPSIPGDRIEVDPNLVQEIINQEDAGFMKKFEARFRQELSQRVPSGN